MTEVFKPRENMKFVDSEWECLDENGYLVCVGGPSCIHGDQWEFYISGIGYHRLDGPANSHGDWYILAKDVTDEIYEFAQENNIDLDNLTDEDKVMIALKFG